MTRMRLWTTVTLLGVTVVAHGALAASITSIGTPGTGPTGDGTTAPAASDGPDAENTAFAQGGDGVASDPPLYPIKPDDRPSDERPHRRRVTLGARGLWE